jgi:enamine deaminase RidA (YjgF/YER057c/UK114 family)
MPGVIEARLQALRIELPLAAPPAANYAPFVSVGPLLFIAGQLPMWQGALRYPGTVGAEVDLEQAKAAARLVGLNILAQAKAGLGDLDRIKRCVRIGAFVQCVDGFSQQPEIVNGLSDLLVEVLGEAGRHARAAVGVNALPRNACVEADAVFAIAD